jgi:hypothetical protein
MMRTAVKVSIIMLSISLLVGCDLSVNSGSEALEMQTSATLVNVTNISIVPTSIESTETASMSTTLTNDPYAALLTKYNWTLTNEVEVQSFTIPTESELDEVPFKLYLDASQKIGLDFTPWAGENLELYRYRLQERTSYNTSVDGYILVADNQVVGAWLSLYGAAPGILALDSELTLE